jgi:hypothetical protein
MDINLTYDRLGRLRAIGGAQLTYGRMGSRPRTLGRWPLQYYNLGNRLRSIGDVEVTYRRIGSLPSTVGPWSIQYDRLGNNMLSIGPYQIGADYGRKRLRAIGPLTVSYDRMGSRPCRVHLPDECIAQWDVLFLILFFMLYQDMREKQEAGRMWAGGVTSHPMV